MNAIVPRATAEQICRDRAKALELYQEFHAILMMAGDVLEQARSYSNRASFGTNRYSQHIKDAEGMDILQKFAVPVQSDFMTVVRKILDTNIWAHIMEITELKRLMDAQGKDELNSQIVLDPPEVSEETIRATVEYWFGNADLIFRRGIANCFSKLDRRFRSHTGWKIGSRVILDNAFDAFGFWSHYRNLSDTLLDIERAFLVLDDVEAPLYGGIVELIDQHRRVGRGPRYTEIRNDYFKIRIYKNGNLHVWFLRDDLLVRVNKLLAEYYGEVIPEEREPDEDDPLSNPKTTPARNYGFFPSPEAVVKMVIDAARLYRSPDDAPLRVLEPNAGTGHISASALFEGASVDCVEIQPHLAEALQRSGQYGQVLCGDFHRCDPKALGLYDRVLMNPPFDRERDIDHVMHAWKFLKENGRLVAVMSAGTEFRETKKSKAFRAFLKENNALVRDLPPGSFSSVGTNVNTILVTINRNGRSVYY